MISGFCREVDEKIALLSCYIASSGKSLAKEYSLPLKLVPTGRPATSVRDYHYWLRNAPEEHSSQAVVLIGSAKSCTDWGFRNVSCSMLIAVLFRQWRTEGGGLGGSNPSRNSEVLTKSNRIAN